MTEILKGLAGLSTEERPKVGQLVNQAKIDISKLIEEKMAYLKEMQLQKNYRPNGSMCHFPDAITNRVLYIQSPK